MSLLLEKERNDKTTTESLTTKPTHGGHKSTLNRVSSSLSQGRKNIKKKITLNSLHEPFGETRYQERKDQASKTRNCECVSAYCLTFAIALM